jgi:hypothetical protein
MRIKLKNPNKLGGGGLRVFIDKLRPRKGKEEGTIKKNEVEGPTTKGRRSKQDNS